MSEEEAAKLAKKMIDAEFDFNDFLKQAQMMKGMGSLGGVANMIPGMAGKLTPQQLNQAEVNKITSTSTRLIPNTVATNELRLRNCIPTVCDS